MDWLGWDIISWDLIECGLMTKYEPVFNYKLSIQAGTENSTKTPISQWLPGALEIWSRQQDNISWRHPVLHTSTEFFKTTIIHHLYSVFRSQASFGLLGFLSLRAEQCYCNFMMTTMFLQYSNISVIREPFRVLQWHRNVVMGSVTAIINIVLTQWERFGDTPDCECWHTD